MQTYEYKHQREIFDSKARAWTRQHAAQMEQGEAAPLPVEVPSPTAANKEQLDVLEDEEPINPGFYKKQALHSASEPSLKIAVDINNENGAGGVGKQKQYAEIEKPSLDTAVLQAEKDTAGIIDPTADAEPPQKKSKLSLQRN